MLCLTWKNWCCVQSGQQEAAALWGKHRAAQEQQLAEARGQLETALQEGSVTQEALQALQLEARQQVHCIRLFSRVLFQCYLHEVLLQAASCAFSVCAAASC